MEDVSISISAKGMRGQMVYTVIANVLKAKGFRVIVNGEIFSAGSKDATVIRISKDVR